MRLVLIIEPKDGNLSRRPLTAEMGHRTPEATFKKLVADAHRKYGVNRFSVVGSHIQGNQVHLNR